MCTSNNVYFSPFCFGAQVFNWATISSFIWNPSNYLKWHWSWSKTHYYYSRNLAMMTTQMEGGSSCIVQWSGNLSKTKRHPSQKRNKRNKAKKQRKWWLQHHCEARRAFILPGHCDEHCQTQTKQPFPAMQTVCVPHFSCASLCKRNLEEWKVF